MDKSAALRRRRRRRRVADDKRKRAARACDLCKTRKSKCIDLGAGKCQRCSENDLHCRFEREVSPLDDDQLVHSSTVSSTRAKSPPDTISIETYQTERALWPGFLSKLRRAFCLEQHSIQEEQSNSAEPAHIDTTHAVPSDPLELARLRRAIDIFPPRPVADFLISVCISHGCDLFFYFDQAQLLEEIDEFYSQPTSALRNDLIFVCLALATLALGSQWTTLEKPECPAPLTRLDDGNPGRVFFDRARALVPDLMERSCIRSIQATFILGVYTLPASAISSSYVYMGLALRKALAADLHQKTDESSLDEREKEIRCRLWWSIFSLERTITVKLNRPRSVEHQIITTPLPAPLPSLDSRQTFDNLQHQIAYAQLVQILDRVADLGSGVNSPPLKASEVEAIETDLKNWKHSLPLDFNMANFGQKSTSYRAVFHLYLNYHYAWIALGKVSLVTVVRAHIRRCFNGGEDVTPNEDVVTRLSRSCIKAGRKILQLFEQLQQNRYISRFSFTDFQGCSIATIVALLAGVLDRDSGYEARVTFGLRCLGTMATGNPTAKMGVRFVEALQSITDEAVEKLNTVSPSANAQHGSAQTSERDYQRWADWLSRTNRQQGSQSLRGVSSVDPDMSISGEEYWPSLSLGDNTMPEWPSSERITASLEQVPTEPQQEAFLDQQSSAPPEIDFLYPLNMDDQSVLMGLTGLDVLDFTQLWP